jgi:SpoIID/LytB domain protein
MGRSRVPTLRRGAAVVVLVLAGLTAASAGPSASAATVTQTVTIGANTHLLVTSRGNGHGHGLSQYGALGAAKAGLLYPAILFFYYPNTVLKQVPSSATIRVRLSNTGPTTTIAAYSSTVVTGVSGTLPTTGIAKYRLAASGTGLKLQKLASAPGATWQTVQTGLANNAEFRRTNGLSQRLYLADGTSTRYYGVLRAVRVSTSDTTAGVRTVNRLSYDRYTQGVIGREMPASWDRAALDAQAVAARTYGDYAVHNPPSAGYYDICDSTSCQVYGGHIHYASNGSVLWQDLPQPALDTARQVLNYNGGPVFAQFSASNGGWTADGGQPYLVAKQDPYDIAAYDPYINQTKTVSVSGVAKSFGLAKLTKLVLVRDGNGTWGGRVLTVSAYNGTTHVDRFGSDLAGYLGLGTTWFQLAPTP